MRHTSPGVFACITLLIAPGIESQYSGFEVEDTRSVVALEPAAKMSKEGMIILSMLALANE